MARLIETNESFIFQLEDLEEASTRRRRMEEGVQVFTSDNYSTVSQVVFSKTIFDFQSAKTFLEENFFVSVSDDQQAQLSDGKEVQISLNSDDKFYDLELNITPFIFNDVKLADEQKYPLLIAKAIPIAPGTHKKFTFGQDVIDDAHKRGVWTESTVVINHQWENPGDSVGVVLSESKNDDGNIEVLMLLTKQIAIEGIKSGLFHSVSTNAIVRANNDLIVSRINRVDELSLTESPAVEVAKVTEFTPVEIDLVSKMTKKEESVSPIRPAPPPAMEVSLRKGESKMEEIEPAPGNDPGTSPHVTSVALEDRIVTLEKENAELKLEQERSKKERIEFAKWQKVQLAERDAADFEKQNKIRLNQVDLTKRMLVQMSDELRKDFEEFLQLQKLTDQADLEMEVGFTDNSHVPYENMSDEQLRLMALAEESGLDDFFTLDKKDIPKDMMQEFI